jgi:DNA-binding MarR family transcriptional regulator
MSQEQLHVDLNTSLGYLVKQTANTLRMSMEAVLRPLGMTITHYACLELLSQRPGLSNSQLARGTFVTRQSMNVLLQALEQNGLVERPSVAPSGRVLPTRLTMLGRKQLEVASAAVKVVEDQMRSSFTQEQDEELRKFLQACIDSLKPLR